LAESALVRIEVFNLNGQRVAIVAENAQSAGYHTTVFDASSLTSGVYLYRLTAIGSTMNFTQTKKFTLLK